MAMRREPAVHRLPKEIWSMILNEAIDQHNPLFFSTTFEGSNWSIFSSLRSLEQEDYLQKRAETQRKIIGSVCRSWQAFSQSRRSRYVYTTLGLLGKSVLSQEIKKARSARRVGLHHLYELVSSPQFVQGFNCEIVEIHQDDVQGLARVPLPRLRRLRMKTWDLFRPSAFLDGLNKFKDITWLDYEALSTPKQPPVVGERISPIVLPNLQVLWYRIRGPLEFPFQYLELPSLRYLSFHINVCPGHIPLIDVLSHYRRTLIGFTIRVKKLHENTPLIRFPSWDDFPRLEELVIDRPWVTNFHPLPSKHPLQRIEAQYDTMDVISSLLRGENMKEITLQGTCWADDGGLTVENKEIMDKAGMDRLLEQATARRIAFKVTLDGKYSQRRARLTENAPRKSSE
ncbi:hypothetical protein CPB86DRAFT_784853 [Serendipita vermifera]|nr:hypothetical protein CPB86DRAFT_784853 [Serendipita vermifera]